MRVFRPISIVPTGGTPKWMMPWAPLSESMTLPPDAEASYDTATGFPYWYSVINMEEVGGPNDSFFNCFYNRVPLWELFAEIGAPDVCDFSIEPRGTEGLAEPMRVSFTDLMTDWIEVSNVVTQTGDRTTFIDDEIKLPNPGFTNPGEDEGAFIYRHQRFMVYAPGSIPTGPQITLDYVMEWRGHEAILYAGRPYVPCKTYYMWSYTDDGGTSFGGYVSHLSELDAITGFDPQFVPLTDQFLTTWRVGYRDFGATTHQAVFGMPAWKFDTEGANFINDGLRTTTTPVDQVELEIDGVVRASNAWVQPDVSTPGHVVKYFPYEDDLGDPLYDQTTGACNVPAVDFPYEM